MLDQLIEKNPYVAAVNFYLYKKIYFCMYKN